MSNYKVYRKQLEGLRQQYLAIKIIYNTSVPADEYIITNEYFDFMNTEIIKLVIGRVFILISDSKYKNYNTISYKILIETLISDQNLNDNKTELQKLLDKVNAIDKKFKSFRDKSFAHIELNSNNNLTKVDEYGICTQEITSLLALAEEIYNTLFFILGESSTNHMHESIEALSNIAWDAFEQANLVKKDSDKLTKYQLNQK
ncbi:MAG: hypothetical protein EP298_02240 [Gammaproteobacteria bacterium]|nr:MAG: hypothetical protein EP298_02240 [Gammaproteobacteria bacterium]UTW43626.1 hypothetical protein KFE69_05925 [bacterium SCSIO 12844]